MLAAPAELRKVRFPQFELRELECWEEVSRDGRLQSGFGIQAAREGQHISETGEKKKK